MDDAVAADEVTLFEVFDELEYLLTNGRKVPLTNNVILNEEDILELVDRIRATLPDDVVKAREMVDQRAKILAAAHEEAELAAARLRAEGQAIVDAAKARAEDMVSDHAIVTEAKHRAAVTVAEADERSRAVLDEADRYAASVMGSLEEQLTKTLATVRKGLDALPSAKRSRRRGRGEQDED